MFAIELVTAALSALTAVVQVPVAVLGSRRAAREVTDVSKSCKSPQCIGGRDITVTGGTVLIVNVNSADEVKEPSGPPPRLPGVRICLDRSSKIPQVQ